MAAAKMVDDWHLYLLAAPGAALGGWSRYALSLAMAARWKRHFPIATLAVNATGAGMIGIFWPLGLAESAGGAFLIYGFLGGYTTVSSFAMETFVLLEEERWKAAAVNVLLSYGLCLAATFAGSWAARTWLT